MDDALTRLAEHLYAGPAPAERRLADPRLGLLTAVTRQPAQPGTPPGWAGYGAHVADTAAYAPWTTDRYGFGAALDDPGRARRAAVGEAVERYCGNIVPAGLPVASFAELAAAGHRAVDPAELALYAPAQYAEPGFPFVPFTRDLTVPWVLGTCLHTGADTYVPARLAYLNLPGPGPATNALCYAGIATGPDRERAERFALEELFERDATALWWTADAPAPHITDDLPTPDGCTLRLRHVPSSFDVPVVAAFLEDGDAGVVAFGSACRADPRDAAVKALVEAVGMYTLTLKLTDPTSDVWGAVADGTIPRHVYRPYRADRRYRDAFRPDLRDLLDLPAVAQLYLDPRMQGEPLDRLRTPDPGTTLAHLPAVDDATARQVYLDRLAAAGLSAVSVDLTTPDVTAAGLRVVRVVVPGLYGNAPPAFPLHGGHRLHTEPVARGWRTGPLTPADLTRPPIPLA
ncbi:YcaO-like family protein [Dactylosporangium sp. NPDC005572]|uniref:YcaO-like family protein n=1 Tax=Dactylosporangium sp. NPDC005572 TaxID=3156889 RepID=UPI0033BAD25D